LLTRDDDDDDSNYSFVPPQVLGTLGTEYSMLVYQP